MDSAEVLTALWHDLGLPDEVRSRASLTGSDPIYPSSFHIGQLAQASIAAVALAAAEVHRRRTGRPQHVSVDCRNAAIEFRSERYFRVNDGEAPELWDKIAGLYRCGDGAWVRIHTNFPHHRDGILKLLGCEHDRDSVQQALTSWTADRFEDAAAAAGMVAAKARTFDDWEAHPQSRAVAALPLISLERIADGPKLAVPPGPRPLDGIRVLELTRVLAGPICGRALAAHGADSLRAISPRLPTIEPADIDTGRGKRSAYVDLTTRGGAEDFRRLLAGSDIFIQSYRPGTLASRGLGPSDAARLRPGLVYVSLSAYGHTGPWAGRRGFDSLVQTATGLNLAEAEAAGEAAPRALPCQALDHASGYLMALGALAGLLRRMDEGGSWLVRVSLARTALWLRGLGRVDNGFNAADFGLDAIDDRLESAPSGYGELKAVKHAAVLSETPALWMRPPTPFGTHPPRW
jgi:crotonobetainyl-CoA:carnitine CoA-transferase CaiB-like acyl-CoA transferase